MTFICVSPPFSCKRTYLILSRLSAPTPVCQWRNTADDYGRKPLGNPLTDIKSTMLREYEIVKRILGSNRCSEQRFQADSGNEFEASGTCPVTCLVTFLEV